MRAVLLIPVIGVNILELFSAGVFSQEAVPPNSGSGLLGSHGYLYGQIAILVTTLLTFIYNLYREGRQRRWELEDRRLAREEAQRKLEDMHQAITENTSVTVAAAVKAGAAERRIAELRALFEGEAATTLDSINEKKTETVERLRNAQKGKRDDGRTRGDDC